MVTVEKQIEFYSWQLHELSKQWESYYHSTVSNLIINKICFLGELHGFDVDRGNLIVKFPLSSAPRLDTSFSFSYFYNLNVLKESFKEFSKKAAGVSENSVLTIYHIGSDTNYIYTAIRNVDYEIFTCFQKVKGSQKIHLLLGEPEPSYKYLLRLRQFIKNHKHLNIIQKTTEREPVFFKNDKVQEIKTALFTDDVTIIQGPPGTGKSTLIAQLIADVCQQKTICVCSLANKAVTELAKKIEESKVSVPIIKTNLSYSEKKEFPFLQPFNKGLLPSSYILLTTYYKLSEQVVFDNKPDFLYDYLVIEEASQAFYTTLVAFKQIAKKLIIIGDQNQLPPIVLKEERAPMEIHPYIGQLINGLETFINSSNYKYYFLNYTFRLPYYNTKLTNHFYNGYLESKNNNKLDLKLSSKFKRLFNCEKPTQLWLQNSFMNTKDLKSWSSVFKELLREINNSHDDLEIAILTSFKKDVSLLQEILYKDMKKSNNKIIIETIDRVQGLTVDITFYLIKYSGSLNFILKKNRFNVATSRSRYYNIIVSDQDLNLVTHLGSVEVQKYFNDIFSL